ncbi:hypothetical protein ElyMa_001638400 [Elysia marginata]|uniref:Uncharacterized protein n=1 Tax=Elysia marginata TaxID=1093978 RepID=A0AAV4JNW0_9GAST|nr:hypothetical protein ElyMa_001638400 [Elysia marginata]
MPDLRPHFLPQYLRMIKDNQPLHSPSPMATTTTTTATSQEDESNPSITNQAAAAALTLSALDTTTSTTTTTSSSSSNGNNNPPSVTQKSGTQTGSEVTDARPAYPDTEPSRTAQQQQQHQDNPPDQEEPSPKTEPVSSSPLKREAAELNPPEEPSPKIGPVSISPADPSPPEEGIVYDSATLRMSVKDKIKRLAKAEAAGTVHIGTNKPPQIAAKAKAMSLPKDARMPDSSNGEHLPDDV